MAASATALSRKHCASQVYVCISCGVVTAVHGLAHFLQFADGFIQQSHFAGGHAEVVMGLGIFLRYC